MKISKLKLKNMFNKEKILTLEKIKKYFDITLNSARYHVSEIGGKTSLNANNKYYSLPSIINYNEDGLWEYENIKFSSSGNLNNTLINKIENAPKGITCPELEQLLGVKLYSTLSNLTLKDKVKREKIGQLFIYFSIDDDRFSIQKSAKLETVRTDNNFLNLIYIYTLIERIKNPYLKSNELAVIIKKQGFPITESNINKFLDYYNIKIGSIGYSEIILLRTLWREVKKRIHLDIKLNSEPKVLFDVRNEISECCGVATTPYKTSSKSVFLLDIGAISAYEKQMYCSECNYVYKSEELLRIAPPNASYSYELMEFVGREMYQKNCQAKEIRLALAERHIKISVSEIEVLAKKFVIYLSELHKEKSSKIVEFMDNNGGYILHLDALGGTGGKRVMSGIDGISNIVLSNAKIDTEHSDSIAPFLNEIKENFGEPLRVVQDMGQGIMKAVKEVFPDVIILICHFHFLRDLGKDLLKGNHALLKERLRAFNTRVKLRALLKETKVIYENQNENDTPEYKTTLLKLYSLIAWVMDWKSDSNGYGFPFDRQHYDLFSRIKKAEQIKLSLNPCCNNLKNLSEIHDTFKGILNEVVNDEISKTTITKIQKEILIFDALREVMQIATVIGNKGLNEENAVDIKTIENGVENFIKKQLTDKIFKKSDKGVKFFKQIQKYKKELFADPIVVKTDHGEKIIQPQRTNNIMEQSFRDFTRHIKRKTGDNSVGRTIQGMIPNTPLVKNLENKEYMNIITKDKNTLSEIFHSININNIRKEMKDFKLSTEKIPDEIRKLLKQDKTIDDVIKDIYY